MRNRIRKFVGDEAGVVAVEYGLIASLISVAIIGSLETVGVRLAATFALVANAL